MKKHFKKIMALAIAMVMVLAMTVPAMAATETVVTDKGTAAFTITINKNTTDKVAHTYGAFQIFKGDLSETKADGTVTDKKLTNIEWGDDIDSTKIADLVAALNTALGLSGDTALDANKATVAADAAKAISNQNYTDDAAGAQALAEIFEAAIDSAASYSGSVDATGTTATISDVAPGYYLVKDTADVTGEGAKTRYILQVVSDVNPVEKADVPSVEKKVKENTTNTVNASGTDTDTRISDYNITAQFNDVADYNIGDVIPFEIVGTIPANYGDYEVYAYKFLDTMSTGLTYFEDDTNKPVVEYRNKVNGAWGTWTPIEAENYTKTGSGQTFKIEFNVTKNGDAYTDKGLKDVAALNAGAQVRVTYYAKLNSAAVIGLPGNVNEVELEFSNNPNKGGEGETGKTPKDKVIVFTYELDSNKYADQIGTGKELAGAKFVLKNADGKYLNYNATTKTVTWKDAPTLTGLQINTDSYVSAFTTADITVFESTSAGVITKIEGLDEGAYTLSEIKAPAGYNLATDATVTITATTVNNQAWNEEPATALTEFKYTVAQDGNSTTTTGSLTDDTKDSIATVNIIDKSGIQLPSTGGIGTTIFYIIGAILVIGAGVVLVTRRRMSAN